MYYNNLELDISIAFSFLLISDISLYGYIIIYLVIHLLYLWTNLLKIFITFKSYNAGVSMK